MIGITPPSDNTWVVIAATIVTSFLVSAALVPIVRWTAHRFSVLDKPEQGKMHSGATPYFGGIAIASVALVIPSLFSGWSQDAAYVGLGALMVSATGLIDDLRTLNPAPRLGIEIIASLLAVKGGAEVQLFNNWLDPVISVVWLVVITNSFNLMDNMDGVAASVAIATSSAILIAATLQEQWLVAALCAAIVGSCLGFLLYNWHPASIFMGDAGSLLLGFLLAVCSIKLRWSTGFQDSVTAVLLIMFPAVFDTILVVVSRTRAGRSIMVGGTDHTTHRLHKLGVPIRGVALLMALTAVLSSTLGIMVGRGVIDRWVAIPPVAVVAGLTFLRMIRMPVYADGAGRESPAPNAK